MTMPGWRPGLGSSPGSVGAHQSGGRVGPPEVRGRTGYYGDAHVSRVELIQELQADGFNLESIRKLLDSAGGSSGGELNFSRTLRAPLEAEEPEILTEGEFAERWGGPLDPRVMARTEMLGLLRDMGDGRYEILSPRLQQAGLELAELGVRPDVALEVVSQVRTSARRVARVFIELFLENVWKPFNDAGRPEEDWPKVRDALERLRPLASEALLVIFQQVMSETVEEVTGREIQRGLATSAADRRPGRRRRRRRAH